MSHAHHLLKLLLLLLAVLAGSQPHGAVAAKFEVKDVTNKTCTIVELLMNFSIKYETVEEKEKLIFFPIPEDAVVSGNSTCGKGSSESSLLVVTFGTGHSVSFSFSRNSSVYYAEKLGVAYNLGDKHIFPDARRNDVSFSSESTGINAQVNTTYVCMTAQEIQMANATVVISAARIEAYVPGSDYSKEETVCEADKTTSTTTVPTTVTPTQPPTPKDPVSIKYNVTSSNGTCLLAQMGLQLNLTYITKYNKTGVEIINIDSNATASGFCESTSVGLSLKSERTSLWLFFSMDTAAQRGSVLHKVRQVVTLRGALNVTNTSLNYLQATLGKSFKCSSKQILQVSPVFALDVFKAQVQAFTVQNGKFGEAEECLLDQNNMLIPIIVGAALAGLVLIVLIAYLIGRKRSHAGYQTI
ncbi:lysosome-associated membrane glycoprotein 1 [Protopterus annectens]|uniref:lysosome-associated membrane glycoprotein 1 n=1 Tax=Protopterus annectens TaxID=7888 RepID=UPI001CF93BA6|nr:lysosome-associated membrane glycoprotein 1 [Protopterus annectens]